MRRLVIAAAFICAVSVAAQKTSIPARRFVRGSALPNTCSVGDVYFKTTATVGQNNCLTANNWTAVTIGGITASSTDTLTNKSLALGSNTVTGTLAQFNTALTDADFARIDAGQTFTGVNVFSSTITGAISGNAGTATALAADPTGCTNQFVSDIAANGTLTCTTVSLAGAQFANQGTTTTVLHGNAAGNPSFAKVVDGDVTFTAPVLGAPTATTLQTSGNVGIGVAPSGTTGQLVTAQSSGNVTTSLRVLNTNAGNATIPVVQTVSDTSIAQIAAYSSAVTASVFGVTIGGWSGLTNGSTGSGLLIGTTNSAPITIGTNSVAALNISAAGAVTMPQMALTAGTMTSVLECGMPGCWTCRAWTLANVTALGATTAGDVSFGTLPAKTIVKNEYVIITGQGGTVTTLTVAVGRVSAGYIDYIVASDAKAAANTIYGDASAERGTNLTGYDLPSYTGTTVINAHFISTGGNLSTVTGSTGQVCLSTEKLP